jgi:hypothetical protein
MAVKEFNFLNVSITVPGTSGKEAYELLCNTLGAVPGIDWQTDVYTSSDDVEGLNERPTSELFPTDAEAEEQAARASVRDQIAYEQSKQCRPSDPIDRMYAEAFADELPQESFELIVRWGDVREEEEPREAKVYTFETEAQRDAYRDGIIEALPDTSRFDFYERNADGTIPDDEEWANEYGDDEDEE